jgi:hypothetical protein
MAGRRRGLQRDGRPAEHLDRARAAAAEGARASGALDGADRALAAAPAGTATVSVSWRIASKRAVTLRACVRTTVQDPVPAQSPVQPENFQPGAACWTRVSVVPGANLPCTSRRCTGFHVGSTSTGCAAIRDGVAREVNASS